MRLLHVIERLAPSGAATQVRLLASAGVAAGDQVTVASLRYPGPDEAAFARAGVAVEWLGGRFAIDPFAAIRLRRLVHRLRPEAIQSWDAASARQCRSARTRGVRWAHVLRSPNETAPAGVDVVLGSDPSLDQTASPAPNAVDPAIAEAALA
ncbi:MAG: glycosyltransferase, partial [Planctomycetota bacterium]